MFHRILVPLDGSLRAELILEYLLPLARERKSELVLARAVYPVSPGPGVEYGKLLGEDLASAEATMARVKDRLALEGIAVRTRLSEGPPVEMLLDTAHEESADLLALTTHGRTGLDRVMLGSVAEGLLRRSPVPVLVIRSFSARIFSGRANPFRHLLVPVDESGLAIELLPYLQAMARSFGSKILLVHVAEALQPAGAFHGSLHGSADLPTRADPIDRMSAELAQDGAAVETLTLGGDPSARIVDVAVSRGADLIVMATHGRTGFSRWIKGSVTESVLRASPIPLLTLGTGR